ncbi:MAG: helix-turn-helix transcriptional regulator [Clostridia bacterium]|nr:helix-turn-helix transcriptional regulator [Clostridia bacterium]
MRVSYKRLWKLLIDRELLKKDLARIANISSYTISKMGNNDNVTVDVLGKICYALGCKLDDIMEFLP